MSIRLSELLFDSQRFNSCLEDSTLRGKVSGTIESQVCGEEELVWMEKISVRVVAEIDGSASPVDFERIGSARQARGWRRVIGEEVEILVLARDSDLPRLGGGSWDLWLRLSLGFDDTTTTRQSDDPGAVGRFHESDGCGSERWVLSDSSPQRLILQQLGPLSLKPCSWIRPGEGLHDLGLELEGQLILVMSWRGGLSK